MVTPFAALTYADTDNYMGRKDGKIFVYLDNTDPLIEKEVIEVGTIDDLYYGMVRPNELASTGQQYSPDLQQWTADDLSVKHESRGFTGHEQLDSCI